MFTKLYSIFMILESLDSITSAASFLFSLNSTKVFVGLIKEVLFECLIPLTSDLELFSWSDISSRTDKYGLPLNFTHVIWNHSTFMWHKSTIFMKRVTIDEDKTWRKQDKGRFVNIYSSLSSPSPYYLLPSPSPYYPPLHIIPLPSPSPHFIPFLSIEEGEGDTKRATNLSPNSKNSNYCLHLAPPPICKRTPV